MWTKRPGLDFISPREAYEAANRGFAGASSQARLFNDSRLRTPLAEQWCAAMFGLGYEEFVGRSCRVAFNGTGYRQDADFFALIDDVERAFQVVEVQEPGRQRGKEYRELESGAIGPIHYHPETGHHEGPGWIAQAIASKVAVNYAGAAHLHLIAYANFPARGLVHAEVVSTTSVHHGRFASIWVITNEMIGTLHSNGDIGAVNGWGIISRAA